MAKKNPTLTDSVEPDAPEVEPVAEVEAEASPFEDGKFYVGVEDGSGGVTYVEVAESETKERRLLLGGRNVEHVSEDASGRWVYRRM